HPCRYQRAGIPCSALGAYAYEAKHIPENKNGITMPATIKPTNKKWIYVALVTAAGIAWWSMDKEQTTGNGPKQDAVNISVATVARSDIPLQLELVGTVVARES